MAAWKRGAVDQIHDRPPIIDEIVRGRVEVVGANDRSNGRLSLERTRIAISVSAGGIVRLSNTTITDNTTGLVNSSGTILSYVNNRIFGNSTNGAPTVSVYQK